MPEVAIGGRHSLLARCKSHSMLLQAAIIRGEHTPGRDEFKMRALFEDLGLIDHPRIVFGDVCSDTIVDVKRAAARRVAVSSVSVASST